MGDQEIALIYKLCSSNIDCIYMKMFVHLIAAWMRQEESSHLHLQKFFDPKLQRYLRNVDGSKSVREGRKNRDRRGGGGERKNKSELSKRRAELMRAIYSKRNTNDSSKNDEEVRKKEEQWVKEKQDIEDDHFGVEVEEEEAYQMIQWAQGLSINDI